MNSGGEGIYCWFFGCRSWSFLTRGRGENKKKKKKFEEEEEEGTVLH